jgi:uncharacterized protein YciI
LKTLFAVTRIAGPAWEPGKPREQQARWRRHADFMNDLAAKGFVVLGGPIGDRDEVLLIIDAPDSKAVEAAFSRDPWTATRQLETKIIQPWTILLDAGQGRDQPRMSG